MKKYLIGMVLMLLLISGCAKEKTSTEMENNKTAQVKEYISENIFTQSPLKKYLTIDWMRKDSV